MIDRLVYRARLDSMGNVVAIGSHTARWSPRSVEAVIADIESGRYRYLVMWESGPEEIVVQDCGFRFDPTRRTIDVAGSDGSAGGLRTLPPA